MTLMAARSGIRCDSMKCESTAVVKGALFSACLGSLLVPFGLALTMLAALEVVFVQNSVVLMRF